MPKNETSESPKIIVHFLLILLSIFDENRTPKIRDKDGMVVSKFTYKYGTSGKFKDIIGINAEIEGAEATTIAAANTAIKYLENSFIFFSILSEMFGHSNFSTIAD